MRRLSHDDVITLANDGKIQDMILKGGAYFIPSHGWLTLPVTKETIIHSSTLGNVHVTVVDDISQSEKLKCVSFGHVIQTDTRRARCDIAFYGDDVDDLLSHMTSHLRHILSVCNHSNLSIAVRHSVDKAKASEIFTHYFGPYQELSKVKSEKVPAAYLMSMPPEPFSKL